MNSDSSSSSSTSSRSPSPHPAAPPTLTTLIHHYTSAKHALTSTHYAHRAAELVTTARTLIPEIAILNARNEYFRHAIGCQIDVLENIKEDVSARAEVVGEGFGRVVEGLDEAGARLKKTVGELRGTGWNTAFQGNGDDGRVAERKVDKKKKTLYDFIDPTAHETLNSAIRTDIDAYHASHADFMLSHNRFTTAMATTNSKIPQQTTSLDEKRSLYDSDPPPTTIRALFEGIEDHATALAELLQGLVRHYDLCVTALKHTEGGGEAAKQATIDTDDKQDIQESLYLRKAPLPISDEERSEMLSVLDRDAAELDDIEAEMRERNAEQEALYSRLLSIAKAARRTDGALREVVVMLAEMRDLHLPSHLHASKTFLSEWERLEISMVEKTDALLGLARSNEGFIFAYAELGKEVQRRKTVQEKVEAIEEKARRDAERLREADASARREFVEEFGGNLPQGIWIASDLR